MHAFNDEKKRLEPTETKCQYCEIAESTDMDDNYFIPLFKEADRTNIVVYRSVKYNKIPVGIPRCKSCQAIHQTATNKSVILGSSFAFLIIILSFLIWDEYGFLGLLAGILIGFGATKFIENKLVRDKGIFTKEDGAKENEAVQDLILNGWSFTMPTA